MIWVNDKGAFFKNPLFYNGRMIFNPKEKTLIAAGYHAYVPPEPEPEPEPEIMPEPEPLVYRFSKYKIKKLLGDEGWAVKKEELENAGLWEDFILAECLATDDDLFGPIWEDLPDEEKQLLIENCQF